MVVYSVISNLRSRLLHTTAAQLFSQCQWTHSNTDINVTSSTDFYISYSDYSYLHIVDVQGCFCSWTHSVTRTR